LEHIYQASGGERTVSRRGETTTFFQVRKRNLPCQSRPLLVLSSKPHPFKNKILSKTARKEKKKPILLREEEEILFDESQLAAVVATVKYATDQRGGGGNPSSWVSLSFRAVLLSSNLFMHVHTP
jgi:hypothetical protein